ncbi:MAG: DNA ligase D [Solirubrobacterales bacterium]|nr:DNA ligase D [Solirubrobacterales bacterium]
MSGEPPPQPMLARAGALPADPANWAFEIKWDGVRAIAADGRLFSRNGRDITASYPELELPGGAVLDGEIVAFDAHNRPSFGLLQRRMHVGRPGEALLTEVPVVYVAFDLLVLGGDDLTAEPYRERRRLLESLDLDVYVPDVHIGTGEELLAATRQAGLEGVIAKRLDSTYVPGRRSDAWIKLKHTRRQEFVIGGWLPGEGQRAERIGALLTGQYRGDEHANGRYSAQNSTALTYTGRVGTGFSDQTLAELKQRLAPLVQPECPFDPKPKLPPNAVYVRPELVAEIEFSEWTADGIMRAPSYKGLRDDKPATEVRPEGRQLKLSNQDKVLYPETGFTKGQLIDYYAAVADTVLPHLRNRALTLKRYPNGVDQSFFYEKNSPSHRPDWVETARIDEIDYTLVNESATLVWLANLADIELHTSLALAAAPAVPTLLAFDLDPGAPAGIIQCAEVAVLLKGLFDQFGLVSCVKTSGSKGLQVYVPLNRPDVDYAQTKAAAKRIAELLEQRLPELVTARMTKARRVGRVLVDWSQNSRSKTTVTAYSMRATATPSVSTPVSWEELEAARAQADPELLRFGPDAVIKRIEQRGDLFAPVLDRVQALPALS